MSDNAERQLGILIGKAESTEKTLDQIQKFQENFDKRLRRIEMASGVISTVAGAVAGFATTLLQGGGSGPQA